MKGIMKFIFLSIIFMFFGFGYVYADEYEKKQTFVSSYTFLYITDDNVLWEKIDIESEPEKIMEDVESIGLGNDGNTLEVLKTDKSLWLIDYKFGSIKNGAAKKIADDVKSVASSEDTVLIIKNDGTLWGMGANYWGELGLGHSDSVHNLIKIDEDIKFVGLDSDYRSVLIIKNDNSLWGCGYNNFNCYDNNSILVPEKIMDDVKEIYEHYYEYSVIKTDNSLWTFNSYTEPKKANDNIVKIKKDYYRDVAVYLKSDGGLWISFVDYYEELEPTKYANNIKDFGFFSDEDIYTLNSDGEWSMIKFSYARAKRGMFDYEYVREPGGLTKLMDDVVHISECGKLALTADKDLYLGIVYYEYDEEGRVIGIDEQELTKLASNVKIPPQAYSIQPSKKVSDYITVRCNGTEVNYGDTAPYITNGRLMIPIRFISEYLESEVEWKDETQTINIKKEDGTEIMLRVDDNKMYYGDNTVEMDVAVEIKNSRAYIPARYIADALDIEVEWIEEIRTVLFYSK